MNDKNKKADLGSRFLAALIDGVIGWVFVVIPILGGVISVLYLLFKDAIPYLVFKDEDWKNKSIGKKIMNMEVYSLEGKTIDLSISAKRNVPLTIGSFIAIVPVIGWIIGPMVAAIFIIFELILLLTNEENRRLGDRWGKTRVIMSKELKTAKKFIKSNM